MRLHVEITERTIAEIDTRDVAKALGKRSLSLRQVIKLLEGNGPFLGDTDWQLWDFDRESRTETETVSVKEIA